jgi:hypothetical protein
MFKSILLGSALGVALLGAPVMAADFQALARLQGAALTPLKDVALAAVERRGTMRGVHYGVRGLWNTRGGV